MAPKKTPGRWQGSTRKQRLPRDWQARRARVLRRDNHRCQALSDGQACRQPATEVDHITAGDDHSLANLQALCTRCHARKSSSEGTSVRQWMSKAKFREAKAHPFYRDE